MSFSVHKGKIARAGAVAALTIGGAAAPVAALAADPTPSPSPSSPAPVSPTPSEPQASDPTPTPTQTPTPTETPTPTPTKTPTKPPASPSPTKPPTKPGSPTKPPTKPPVTPRPTEPAPLISLGLTVSSHNVTPGASVLATVRVSASRSVARHTLVRLTASHASASLHTSGALGNVSAARTLEGTIAVPAGAKPTTITVLAVVTADRAGSRRVTQTVQVALPGAVAAGGVSAAPVLPLGSSDYVPTLANPQLGLPMIAAPQVSPTSPNAATSYPFLTPAALRSNVSPLGTPYGMLVTTAQAGWVSSLLCGILLLRFRLARNLIQPTNRAALVAARRRRSRGRRPDRRVR